jgi:hypothetical protein
MKLSGETVWGTNNVAYLAQANASLLTNKKGFKKF